MKNDIEIDIENEIQTKKVIIDDFYKDAVSLEVRWNADGCRFIESVTEIPIQE